MMTDLSQLLEAVKANDVDAVEQCLAVEPALLQARTDSGLTPVLMAVYARADQVLERLLGRQPDLDVCEAAALGHTELVRERVRVDPDAASATGADGWTPIHLAAFFGRADTTRALLELDADVGALSSNPLRNTPLHAAIAGGRDPEVIGVLLEAGAAVDSVAGGGLTPLHVAAARGDREIVERLVDRGASVGAETAEGKTPADVAEQYGHPDTAARLRDLAG